MHSSDVQVTIMNDIEEMQFEYPSNIPMTDLTFTNSEEFLLLLIDWLAFLSIDILVLLVGCQTA